MSAHVIYSAQSRELKVKALYKCLSWHKANLI